MSDAQQTATAALLVVAERQLAEARTALTNVTARLSIENANLLGARVDLETANADLAHANRDLMTSDGLLAAARAARATAQAELATANATLTTAQADLAIAQRDLATEQGLHQRLIASIRPGYVAPLPPVVTHRTLLTQYNQVRNDSAYWRHMFIRTEPHIRELNQDKGNLEREIRLVRNENAQLRARQAAMDAQVAAAAAAAPAAVGGAPAPAPAPPAPLLAVPRVPRRLRIPPGQERRNPRRASTRLPVDYANSGVGRMGRMPRPRPRR
ncbi:MAG: hypothetical protein M1833_004347 [Piccolia ochrophora]|nr:MAG: hypothetical protein M1833_004347 [Piccolia ochrophora]